MGKPGGYSLLHFSSPPPRTLTSEFVPGSSDQPPIDLRETEDSELNLGDDNLTVGCVSAQAPLVLREPARQLPAGPGSVGLFISAALTLGAWQVVRSVRHVHLGNLPEWYQSNTPDQIGHAVVFDLQYVPIAPCPLNQPYGEPGNFVNHWRETWSRGLPQYFVTAESPRSPPSFFL